MPVRDNCPCADCVQRRLSARARESSQREGQDWCDDENAWRDGESTRVIRYGAPIQVCGVCLTDRYTLCSTCGQLSPSGELSTVTSGLSVCVNCIRAEIRDNGGNSIECAACNCNVYQDPDHDCDGAGTDVPMINCDDCGRLTRTTNTVAEGEVCDSCYSDYSPCDQCGDAYHDDNLNSVDVTDLVCNGCREDSYRECTHCNSWYPEDYVECPNDHDGCRCYTCRQRGNVIKNYSYKPDPDFRGTGPMFLGMELEVAVDRDRDRHSAARKVQELLGNLVYLKDDGSIGHGFEIVTHPMSYDWAMESFPWEELAELPGAGCYASDSCGIHVHVSREAFTGPAHEYRFLQLWHGNEPDISKVARRQGSSWAQFLTRPSDRNVILKGVADKSAYDHERYRAVNTQNQATFEVRVFASTLQVPVIKADLGLVAATVEYAGQLKPDRSAYELDLLDATETEAWKWAAFVEWVNGQGKYDPLSAEIVRVGAVPSASSVFRFASTRTSNTSTTSSSTFLLNDGEIF